MYAGALGDNAIERYAMFLTSLDSSIDEKERRLALTRARDHGLDMHRVAIATAERTVEKAFSVRPLKGTVIPERMRLTIEHTQALPPTKGPLPPIIGMQPPPSDAEMLLLRSIEWTTFLESTYETALEQANVILRYFLGASLQRSCGPMIPFANIKCSQWASIIREVSARRAASRPRAHSPARRPRHGVPALSSVLHRLGVAGTRCRVSGTGGSADEPRNADCVVGGLQGTI